MIEPETCKGSTALLFKSQLKQIKMNTTITLTEKQVENLPKAIEELIVIYNTNTGAINYSTLRDLDEIRTLCQLVQD